MVCFALGYHGYHWLNPYYWLKLFFHQTILPMTVGGAFIRVLSPPQS